jgi:PBSX family phage terminase large subunit
LEVALIPQSFFNQATARLSVDGSKCMVCCNPASPHHWFYQDVLKHLKEKNGMYVHFTMDDNLTLSEEVKNRYKTMYSGVFKKRFIDGKHLLSF